MSQDGSCVSGRLRGLLLGFALLAVPACNRADPSPEAQAERTFTTVCAKCHGADGKGGLPAYEGANAPRNFCDASFQASRTDEDLKQAIRKGKGGMPAFGNLFSDVELRGLVQKLRRFTPVDKAH